MKCLNCGKSKKEFLNFGRMPLANEYLKKNNKGNRKYKLALSICYDCKLVQLTKRPSEKKLYSNYFWQTDSSDLIKKYLNNFFKFFKKNYINKKNSKTIEIASNDGYLLNYFKSKKINIMGVEPASNLANACKKKGLDVINVFFNKREARALKKNYGAFDYLIARNVLAHIDNINNFFEAIDLITHTDSIIFIEFHSLSEIIKLNQYDSVYHEHNYYLSLSFIEKLSKKFGFYSFDALNGPIGAGSLLVSMSKNKKNSLKSIDYKKQIQIEKKLSLNKRKTYDHFSYKVANHKAELYNVCLDQSKKGKKIAAIGASARGNTLVNYTQIKKFIDVYFDRNKLKDNYIYPGTNTEILTTDIKKIKKFDVLLILAWNFKKEIINYLNKNKYKGTVIIPLPHVEIIILQ